MATGFDFSAFDRATDPIFKLLTPEQAHVIVEFRGDERLAQRVEELAAKCHDGRLTEAERAEHEAYLSANHFIGLLQAKARRRLSESAALSCGAEAVEPEDAGAARRLKIKTPPNSMLLKLARRATVPPEIEDIQEERPW